VGEAELLRDDEGEQGILDASPEIFRNFSWWNFRSLNDFWEQNKLPAFTDAGAVQDVLRL